MKKLRPVMLGLCALGLLAAPLAAAQASPPPGFAPDPELMELRAELGARLLLQQLALSPEQTKQWKAQARAVAELKAELARVVEGHRAVLKDQLRAVNDEWRKSGAPDEAKLAERLEANRPDREEIEAPRRSLEDALRGLLDTLTAEQVAALRDFRPFPEFGGKFGPGRLPPRTAEEFLVSVRDMPDAMWDALRARMEERAQRAKIGKRGKRAAQFAQLLAEVRAMSEDEYAARKDELAAKIPQRLIRGLGAGPGPGMGPAMDGMDMGPEDEPPPPDGPADKLEADDDQDFGWKRRQRFVRMLLLSDAFWKVMAEE